MSPPPSYRPDTIAPNSRRHDISPLNSRRGPGYGDPNRSSPPTSRRHGSPPTSQRSLLSNGHQSMIRPGNFRNQDSSRSSPEHRAYNAPLDDMVDDPTAMHSARSVVYKAPPLPQKVPAKNPNLVFAEKAIQAITNGQPLPVDQENSVMRSPMSTVKPKDLNEPIEPEDTDTTDYVFDSEELETLSLPETVYSTAMILPLAFDSEHEKSRRLAVMYAAFSSWGLLGTNLFVQGSLIYYIADVNATKKLDRLCMEEHLLNVMALIVFVSSTITDLLQTFDMYAWLYAVPTMKVHTKLSIAVAEDGSRRWFSGMTRNHKIVCAFGILLPKLLIVLALIVFGTVYVLKSVTTEEILLVMVAMTFILGMDEVFYATFTPIDAMKVLQDLPPIQIDPSAKRRMWTLCVRPSLTAILFLVIAVSLYIDTCLTRYF
eukprot:CAMPEP_0114549764 /NCGR_PEP_ID=MMETSP0114-20121206/5698_1 /TAXON_ID=31324 /ORGANISM="Goniomonas sp, Strain m" /LENGTH=428 /DNA_ID=CAMNT_0001734461 /DNA_START=126 /DNA_END=1412 /DNA_ORIENTATION=+